MTISHSKFANIARFIQNEESHIDKIEIYVRRLEFSTLQKKFKQSFSRTK